MFPTVLTSNEVSCTANGGSDVYDGPGGRLRAVPRRMTMHSARLGGPLLQLVNPRPEQRAIIRHRGKLRNPVEDVVRLKAITDVARPAPHGSTHLGASGATVRRKAQDCSSAGHTYAS